MRQGNGKPTSSPLTGLSERKRSRSITWQEADVKTLLNVIEMVTESGGLVSFSKTSDGGAIRMFIKQDRDSANFYASTADEIDEQLADLERRYRE